MVFVRGFIVWLGIIVAESLHGTARRFLLEPYIGDFRASQIRMFTGAAIILVISMVSIRWIGAKSINLLLGVGLLWLVLTLSFEFLLGRLILGYSWERIIAEYNLIKGGLMAIGLMALMVSPVIAARWRGIISGSIAAN
jgi:hypothetical protein